MKKHRTVAIVLAAGLGTRMGSTLPKVLHPLGGRPMLLQLFETLSNVLPDTTVLVTGPDMDPVSGMVANHLQVIERQIALAKFLLQALS